jgi:Na+-transporting NADH:ubiquinone oxidoreductase subunit C
MNKYIRMLVFVGLLGGISGGLLFSAGLATNTLILANEQALLKSEILTAHGIEFNFTNIHDVFDGAITTITIERDYGDKEDFAFTFYQDNTSGLITYQFGPIFGGGVWGPILGIITLDSLDEDISTIVRISILKQEETPGLGGIVATRKYLDNFVNKTIGLEEDALFIIKGLNPVGAADNQVPAITGATGTSSRFQTILNRSYAAHKAVWDTRG